MSLSSFSKIIIAPVVGCSFGCLGRAGRFRRRHLWRRYLAGGDLSGAEAYQGDHTCVRPAERTRTTLDNRQASNRVSATDRTYGTATCRQGYVWRESYVGDTTCVTPAERARVKAENARAPGRYQ